MGTIFLKSTNNRFPKNNWLILEWGGGNLRILTCIAIQIIAAFYKIITGNSALTSSFRLTPNSGIPRKIMSYFPNEALRRVCKHFYGAQEICMKGREK